MGAQVFFRTSSGKTAREAFDEAVRRACHEHGHSGYTGSMAEKEGFVMIPLPHGEEAPSFANRLIDDDDERIDDKWGPAGCIQFDVDSETGRKQFLFFGWASS